MKMRAVCLREPWLYLMLELPAPYRKNIENRERCLVRSMGPILVKSSARKAKLKGVDQDLDYYNATRRKVVEEMRAVPAELFPAFEQLQFGGIRGAFNFAELIEPGGARGSRYPWKFPDHFGYVVDRARLLPFRPLKGGGQGIFYTDVTNEEAEALSGAGLLPVVERSTLKITSLELDYEGSAEGAKRVLGAVGGLLTGGAR